MIRRMCSLCANYSRGTKGRVARRCAVCCVQRWPRSTIRRLLCPTITGNLELGLVVLADLSLDTSPRASVEFGLISEV